MRESIWDCSATGLRSPWTGTARLPPTSCCPPDIPPSSGFSTNTMNIGKVRNQGWEFTLQTENFNTKNFRWTTDFNIAFNRNKVLALSHNQESIVNVISYNNAYITKIGKPMGVLYGYISEGTYKYDDFDNVDGKWVLKADIPDNGTGRSGRAGPRATRASATSTATARSLTPTTGTIIGRGQPLHTGGFDDTFEFFGFDLNVFFRSGITATTSSTPRARSSYAANRRSATTAGRSTADAGLPKIR